MKNAKRGYLLAEVLVFSFVLMMVIASAVSAVTLAVRGILNDGDRRASITAFENVIARISANEIYGSYEDDFVSVSVSGRGEHFAPIDVVMDVKTLGSMSGIELKWRRRDIRTER